jgi:hypothetical protein
LAFVYLAVALDEILSDEEEFTMLLAELVQFRFR